MPSTIATPDTYDPAVHPGILSRHEITVPIKKSDMFQRGYTPQYREIDEVSNVPPSEAGFSALEGALERMPYLGHLAKAVVFYPVADGGFSMEPRGDGVIAFGKNMRVGGRFYPTDESLRPYLYVKTYIREWLERDGKEWKPRVKPPLPLIGLEVPPEFSQDSFYMTLFHEGAHGIDARVSTPGITASNHPIYSTFAQVAGWQLGANPYRVMAEFDAKKRNSGYPEGIVTCDGIESLTRQFGERVEWLNPNFDWEKAMPQYMQVSPDRYGRDRYRVDLPRDGPHSSPHEALFVFKGMSPFVPPYLKVERGSPRHELLSDPRIWEVFAQAYALYLTNPTVLTGDETAYFGKLHAGLMDLDSSERFLGEVARNPKILLK